MNQTFFLGQLRLALVAIIAYAGGKGWLTPTDAGLATAMLTSLGPLLGPWAWSIYANINSKLVPQHSVVIDPVVTMANVGAATATVRTDAGKITGKVVSVMLIAFAMSAFLAMPSAQAQTRKLVAPAVTGDLKKDLNTDGQNLGLIPKSLQVQPTGNVAADLKTLWDKIIAANNTDLAYASKLAAGAGTQASLIRKQCWDAIVALNEQANGLNLKNADGTLMARPDPHLFTDVETLAEVVDNLSPQGPLFVSCAGAAQLAKTNVLTFINAAVTGAAGIAAMPIIPGL
jgi:hypothetical protein